MHTPHPPRPSGPPPGGRPGESDESLAGPLRAGSDAEGSRSAALLMARHWRSAQDYAVICLAASGPLAHMVTATAFHQVLGRLALGEPADALRPRLLATVRDTVVNWSTTDRVTAELPGLATPAGGHGVRVGPAPTPANRVLTDRAFHGLSRPEQALLWHTEVEAEPPEVPAALLGVDAGSATAALEQAREKFREGLVRTHRELAPGRECRYYNRLLDVPIRRGGALLPDVQEHLAGCAHCRHAAGQLGLAEAATGVLLAEAVLGWGARRYLDSRPGRRPPGPTRPRGGSRGSGGRRSGGGGPGLLARLTGPGARRRAGPGGSGLPGRLLAGARARRAAGPARSPRALFAGLGVASAGLLATVLAVSVWPDGDDGTGPVATTTPGSAASPPPASAADPGTTGLPSTGPPGPGTTGLPEPGTTGLPAVGGTGRLRNAAAGLCLDVEGTPEAGASAVLTGCSTAATQRWTYGTDGLLRSAAGPALCLDSHADAGVAVLGECAAAGSPRGDDVRYDLTARGEFLPRWDRTLALAAGDGPGADVVVKARDGSAGRRWAAARSAGVLDQVRR
ncbi:RICIN domain-containing protein [Streptomyces sp. NPDC013455]|uniref:RICIN domain-containing protein n=1 Tax=Streptomyces sp. NPDC013455 TaxID=3155605 RepID=UPI0033F504BE